MAVNNLNTYAGWQQDGRQVVSGAKAEHYGKTEDGNYLALFHMNQTEELEPVDWDSLEILTAIEREAQRSGKEPRVLVRLTADPSGFTELALWCGSNKKIIDMLKKNKWRYDGKRHRWIATRQTSLIDEIIKAFTYYKVGVEIESDNRTDVPVVTL